MSLQLQRRFHTCHQVRHQNCGGGVIEPKAGWLHTVLTCGAGRTARPAVLIPGTPDVAELQMQGKHSPGIYFRVTYSLLGRENIWEIAEEPVARVRCWTSTPLLTPPPFWSSLVIGPEHQLVLLHLLCNVTWTKEANGPMASRQTMTQAGAPHPTRLVPYTRHPVYAAGYNQGTFKRLWSNFHAKFCPYIHSHFRFRRLFRPFNAPFFYPATILVR